MAPRNPRPELRDKRKREILEAAAAVFAERGFRIDHTRMFTFLKVPWAKTIDDVLKVSKKKLTSTRQELNSQFSTEEAIHALVQGFETALNVKFVKEKLTEYEQKLAEKIRKEKFVTEDWNLLGKSSV